MQARDIESEMQQYNALFAAILDLDVDETAQLEAVKAALEMSPGLVNEPFNAGSQESPRWVYPLAVASNPDTVALLLKCGADPCRIGYCPFGMDFSLLERKDLTSLEAALKDLNQDNYPRFEKFLPYIKKPDIFSIAKEIIKKSYIRNPSLFKGFSWMEAIEKYFKPILELLLPQLEQIDLDNLAKENIALRKAYESFLIYDFIHQILCNAEKTRVSELAMVFKQWTKAKNHNNVPLEVKKRFFEPLTSLEAWCFITMTALEHHVTQIGYFNRIYSLFQVGWYLPRIHFNTDLTEGNAAEILVDITKESRDHPDSTLSLAWKTAKMLMYDPARDAKDLSLVWDIRRRYASQIAVEQTPFSEHIYSILGTIKTCLLALSTKDLPGLLFLVALTCGVTSLTFALLSIHIAIAALLLFIAVPASLGAFCLWNLQSKGSCLSSIL